MSDELHIFKCSSQFGQQANIDQRCKKLFCATLFTVLPCCHLKQKAPELMLTKTQKGPFRFPAKIVSLPRRLFPAHYAPLEISPPALLLS